MSMTPRDLAKFEKLWQIIANWQKRRVCNVESLKERMESLEGIMIFSLLCDMGEQGLTPEQYECLKRVGMKELFDDIVAELRKKQ